MEFKNKKFSILGIQRSGLAVAEILLELGALPFLSDCGKLENSIKSKILDMNINWEEDGHTNKVLDSSIIVISPGVPSNIDIIKKAKNKGIIVISEIELASQITNALLVGITGSNGKTTVTTLLESILAKTKLEYRCGGNIGNALVKEAYALSKKDSILLAEISSFQLENIVAFKPNIAVILNLTPDHLDRYKSKDDYYKAKENIFKNMNKNDILILNEDDTEIKNRKNNYNTNAKILSFSLKQKITNGAYIKNDTIYLNNNGIDQKIIGIKETSFVGEHNVSNALAVLLVATYLDISIEIIKSCFTSFSGVEHRLEFIKKTNGVKFYNDSKATNIASMHTAIKSFDSNIILIAGGRDKGSDFSVLQKDVFKRIKKTFLIGEASKMIMDCWKDSETQKCSSLEIAVTEAFAYSQKGDVILLSPGCASFDMFKNYEDRGNCFKEIVGNL